LLSALDSLTERLAPPTVAGSSPIFEDGFGERSLAFDPETGDAVELLSFTPRLVEAAGFAEAVGERVARLARNRHMSYARVRRIDRPAEDTLVLVSDRVAGWRLADVLRLTERESMPLDISAIIALMRHLIPAAALFSRQQRDASNGAIAPERLLLTPTGKLVIADYVLGPAVEKLQLTRERLWRELRVVLPPGANTTKLPPTVDVVAMGVVALSLVLGRTLRDDEFLVSLGDLLDQAHEYSGGASRPLAPGFKDWLSRTLQFDEHSALATPQEAQVAFEEMLAKERAYVTSSGPLDAFIARVQTLAGLPPEPYRAPAPAAPEPVAVAAPVAAPEPAESPRRPDSGSRIAIHTGPSDPVAAAPVIDHAESFVVHAEQRAGTEAAPSGEHRVATDAVSLDAPVAPIAPEPAPVAVEHSTAPGAPVAPRATASPWTTTLLVLLAVIALAEGGVIAWLMTRTDAPALTDRGELVVQSRPVAARVTIDGEERGITPFSADLSPGAHILEVRVGRSEPRVIPVMIRAGIQSGIYVELQSVATVGAVDVRSDPAKARVSVDGQYRGMAPLVIKDLPPGDHEVMLEANGRQVKQTVRVEAGVTSQLVVPLGSR
jgi:hypothetical protein